MTLPALSTARASYLRAGAGDNQRFIVHHRPSGHARAALVFIHAFGEEMNRSRRMVARASSLLARQGCAVLQIDLQGCGDSSGDFGSATWQQWLEDIDLAAHWMRRQHPDIPLILWGHRAGCLLATAAACNVNATGLLLWQPVASGKGVLQQLIRLKAVAGLQAGSKGSDAQARGLAHSTGAVRAEWDAGRPVHIAGYQVSSALARGLDQALLAPPEGLAGIAWLEVSSQEPTVLLPGSEALLQKWRMAGQAIHTRAVGGPAFWQTQEIEDAPELWHATGEAVNALLARVGACAPVAADAGRSADQVAGPAVERALRFDCEGDQLVGVLTSSSGQSLHAGVLIVVGGPQYRAGSHRQFVELARALAAAGYPTLRFDMRGMGDSCGELAGFEYAAADIRAAAGALAEQLPPGTPIVLWGLCDGASAALLSANSCSVPSVSGLILANTWVRSEVSLARTHIKHYYLDRLRRPDFWSKVLHGGVGIKATRELVDKLVTTHFRNGTAGRKPMSFQQRMASEYAAFDGRVLLLQSGADLTAREFEDFTARDAAWQEAFRLRPPTTVTLPGADHTFSEPSHQVAAQRATIDWLERLVAGRL